MATFGPIFARRADEPLGRAKAALGAGKVREALDAIDPKTLAGALRKGLDDVAAASGASRRDVEALIAWDPVDRALASLGESRAAAAAVWAELPPVAGGLLTGVAEVTTVAGNDDVGFYLDRLAEKMSRDRSLAGPIDQLAADVEVWQRLVADIGAKVDEHPSLLAARRSRVLLRAGLVLLAIAIAVPTAIALVIGWRARVAARERVEVALAADDPCQAEAIPADDLAVAGAAAQARADERLAACRVVREEAARLAGCKILVEAVERGGEPPTDAVTAAGDAAPLVIRVARRSLDRDDLTTTPAWPCAEVGAEKVLWKAFVDAAGKDLSIWQNPPAMPDAVVEQLVALGLSPTARGTLLGRAESVSGHGVRQGDAESLRRGAELCALARRLKIETAGNCRGLDVVLAKTKR